MRPRPLELRRLLSMLAAQGFDDQPLLLGRRPLLVEDTQAEDAIADYRLRRVGRDVGPSLLADFEKRRFLDRPSESATGRFAR